MGPRANGFDLIYPKNLQIALKSRAMDYTRLGRTGLKVSRLCLGTMNFGPETTEADSHRIMDRGLELGINFSIPPTSTAGSGGKAGPSRS